MEINEEVIIELQTKLSFQKDLLANLNQVITDQQAQPTCDVKTTDIYTDVIKQGADGVKSPLSKLLG